MLELNGFVDKDGAAHIVNRYHLTQWFEQNKNGKFTLKIERRKKKRSTNQNAYYWGVVIPLVRDRLLQLGNEFSLQDTHEALKARFNTKEVYNEHGVVDELVQSTGILSTGEFMEYLDKIQRWSNTFLDLIIPQPNEPLTIDFKND